MACVHYVRPMFEAVRDSRYDELKELANKVFKAVNLDPDKTWVVSIDGDETDRVEMMPAAPVRVHTEREHRLVAMTEVEMFTVYSVIES